MHTSNLAIYLKMLFHNDCAQNKHDPFSKLNLIEMS